MSQTQFRYSQTSFQSSVLAALGLTAIVSFLIWLFAQLFAVIHYNWLTIVSALIFFSFCSAVMIWRYIRRDVIVAVRPDGLYDARHSSQAIPWEAIKDLRLGRVENEFQIIVYLWPREQQAGDEQVEFVIDTAPLDGGIEQVVNALNLHKPVAVPQG